MSDNRDPSSMSPEELKAEIQKARLQLELETERLCLLGLQCFYEIGRRLAEKRNRFERGEVVTLDADKMREFHQQGIINFFWSRERFCYNT